MNRKILALAFLCAPVWLAAESDHLAFAWDPGTAAAYTFPRMCSYPGPYNANTCPGPGRQSLQKATTAGAATTTVTSATASTGAFTGVGIGDQIVFASAVNATTGAVEEVVRFVTAAASADSITVDSNVTIPAAGSSFVWYHLDVGTAADSGYIVYPTAGAITFNAMVTTLNATSLDYKLECRQCNLDRCNAPVAMAGPTNIVAATTSAIRVNIFTEQTDQCRFGLKLNTDTGVQSITITYKTERAR